jgi:hypothetical protein
MEKEKKEKEKKKDQKTFLPSILERNKNGTMKSFSFRNFLNDEIFI